MKTNKLMVLMVLLVGMASLGAAGSAIETNTYGKGTYTYTLPSDAGGFNLTVSGAEGGDGGDGSGDNEPGGNGGQGGEISINKQQDVDGGETIEIKVGSAGGDGVSDCNGCGGGGGGGSSLVLFEGTDLLGAGGGGGGGGSGSQGEDGGDGGDNNGQDGKDGFSAGGDGGTGYGSCSGGDGGTGSDNIAGSVGEDGTDGTTCLYDTADTTSTGINYGDGSAKITAIKYNSPPQFNSSKVSPNAPLIGENVSYSTEVYDPDGSIQETTLDLNYGGSTVVSEESRTGTNPSWNDIYEPSSGNKWLNATLTTKDDAGATTTKEINRYLEDKDPVLTVNSPNSSIKSSNTVSWNISTNKLDSDPNEDLTLDIYKNGGLENTYSITEGDSQTGSLTYSDGTSQTFNATVTESDGKQDSGLVSFDVDTSPPVIDIKDPSGDVETKTPDLNYTVSDPHLDSSSCEYSKDGGTRISISNCGNTSLTFNTVGDHNVTVYGSDTVNNEGQDFSQFITHYENRISTKDKSSGSSIQDFEVTFDNGASTAGGSTSDGTFEINTSEIPYGSTNMTLKSSGYKIREINVGQVDDSFELRNTYDLERSSFTLDAKDEQGDSQIKFNFTARNSSTSYSENNITSFEKDWQNFDSIGFPTGAVTITVEDADGERKTRKYYVTLDENSVVSVVAYLLDNNEGIFTSVETYDSKQERLSDVQVTAQKKINGNWKQVSQGITGTDGSASFFLDPDIQYRAVASKTGYDTFEGTFNPVNYQYDPLKINLGQSGKYNFSTRWDTVNYKLEPESKFLNKSTTETLSWTVSDLQGDLTEYGIRVKYENGTEIKSSNIKNSPSGGKINVSLDGSNWDQNQEFHTEAYFITSGKKYRIEKIYEFERSWTEGIFSLSKILNTNGENLSDASRGLMALLITGVFGAGFGSRIGRDGAGFVVVALLGMFSIAGWFPMSVWTLTFLALLGIYVYR